jgi:hypothetical protein
MLIPKQRLPILQLYEKLLQASEIPVTESADIFSKGLYLTKDGQKKIYIKQSLSHSEKLKILLHEYSHHIHLTHYFKQESRAECEIIASGSASFICREFGLKLCKEMDLSKFSADVSFINRVESAIRSVASHILNELRDDENA